MDQTSSALPSEPDVPPVSSELTEQDRWRWSWPVKLVFIFTGVVLPVICFLLGNIPAPSWQSGELADYAKLLLSPIAACPFYPLLLYSITSMWLFVFAPARSSKSFLLRLGIYTGVLLAIQYWFILSISLAEGDSPITDLFFIAIGSGFCICIPWCAYLAVRILGGKFGHDLIGGISLCTVLFLFALGAAFSGVGPGGVLVLLIFFCLFSSTSWAITAYTAMTVFVLRNSGSSRFQFSLARLFGVFTWLAVYFGSWRISITLMLQEYAKLPESACYISTAAARGHRRLVGAEQSIRLSGEAYRVNDQMRYLKCGEWMLARAAPRCHRVCRAVYDRLGPVLAAALVHPLLADVAYLSLKPAEWTCRVCLMLLLPNSREVVAGIYGPPTDESPR